MYSYSGRSIETVVLVQGQLPYIWFIALVKLADRQTLARHAANSMLRASLPGQEHHLYLPPGWLLQRKHLVSSEDLCLFASSCPRHKEIYSQSWQQSRFHHWHPARCRLEPSGPWLIVIGPGNGYDGCFTAAGFTHRAQTGGCRAQTHTDSAHTRKTSHWAARR